MCGLYAQKTRPEYAPQHRPSFPRRREPREKQSTPSLLPRPQKATVKVNRGQTGGASAKICAISVIRGSDKTVPFAKRQQGVSGAAVQTPTNITVHAHPFPIHIPTINLNIQTHNCYLLPMSYIVEPLTLWPRIDGSGHLSSRETTRGIKDHYVEGINGHFQSHRIHR